MKTKRRTFWSFFTRIGAGFFAFWLAVMAVFTVLLSQQRAKLMLAEMESKSDKLMGEDTDFLLDPSSYDTTDETELRRRLSKPVFMADSADPPNLQIIETAITDLNSGKVLQPVPRGYERSAARGVRGGSCGCGHRRVENRIAAEDDL